MQPNLGSSGDCSVEIINIVETPAPKRRKIQHRDPKSVTRTALLQENNRDVTSSVHENHNHVVQAADVIVLSSSPSISVAPASEQLSSITRLGAEAISLLDETNTPLSSKGPFKVTSEAAAARVGGNLESINRILGQIAANSYAEGRLSEQECSQASTQQSVRARKHVQSEEKSANREAARLAREETKKLKQREKVGSPYYVFNNRKPNKPNVSVFVG